MRGSERSMVVRLWLVAGLLCVGVLGLADCRSASIPRVVKIGLVGSFEGLHRGAGYEALFAVKLALAEWNARGGVAGHPVELVALDDSGNPRRARQKPGELAVDADVMGAVGHTLGTVTDAALAEYGVQGLPLVAAVGRMRDSRSDWVFSVAADYWREVEAALALAGVAEGEVVVVLGDEDAWLASGAEALDSWNVLTWNVNRDGRLPPTRGEAVALVGAAADAAEWAAALRDVPGLVMAGGSELRTEVFGALISEAEASIWTGHTALVAGPDTWNLFRDKYVALAGSEPGVLAPVAYDAANVLLAAMERAARSGELSREAVARALQQTEWNGLTGHIAFDGDGSRTDVQVTAHRMPLPAW